MKKPSKKTVAKKRTRFLWILGIVLVMSVSFMTYLFSTVTSPKIVYIPEGSVFKSITQLQKDGVNVHWIDAYILRLIGKPQQGWINIKDEKLSRIVYLYRLTTAKAALQEITLIPGETTYMFLYQIASELHLEYDLLKKAYDEKASMSEGNFVPDTYSIPRKITEERLIAYLLDKSDKKMKQIFAEYNQPFNTKNMLHIVTKASVIQKEAASIDDMPMVSSVIDNRIKEGMRLQMDGTLNYAEFSHQKVTAKRIRTDTTPYNTYKYKGLPTSPVCNVSKEAIHAAIYPAQTDYLYFVRGKNGEHIYSSYFSTHRKNILNATK